MMWLKKVRKIFAHYGCLSICPNITHAPKTRDENLRKYVGKTGKKMKSTFYTF